MVIPPATSEAAISLSGPGLPDGPLAASDHQHVSENGVLHLGISLPEPDQAALAFRARVFDIEDASQSLSDVDWSGEAAQTDTLADLSPPPQSGETEGAVAGQLAGHFEVQSAGPHSFHLDAQSDAVLFIDGQQVLQSDGLPGADPLETTLDLAPGHHAIEVRYIEAADRSGLSIEVTEPGASEPSPLLPSALPPEEADMTPSVSDLGDFQVEFFNLDHSIRRLDDIDWSQEADHQDAFGQIDFENSRESFWEGGQKDRFAVRVTGELDVDASGVKHFALAADDGAVLYIDGQEVIDNDGLHGFRQRQGSVELEEGSHSFEIRYFENGGRAGLKFMESDTGSGDWSLVSGSEAGAVALGDPVVLPEPVVELSGFPADTLVLAGDQVAMAGNEPMDVSGWDLSQLEIAPPPGYSGQISWRVQSRVPGQDGAEDHVAVGPLETVTVHADMFSPDAPSPSVDPLLGMNMPEQGAPGWSDDDFGGGQEAAHGDAGDDVLNEEIVVPGTEAAEQVSLDPIDQPNW